MVFKTKKRAVWVKQVSHVCLIGLLCIGTSCVAPSEREAAQMQRIDQLIAQQQLALDIIATMSENRAAQPQPRAVEPQPMAPAALQTSQPRQQNAMKGRLRSVGSDTMDPLMETWSKAFALNYPNVSFYHQGRGSSTAIPALMDKSSELGPMSRVLKGAEIERFNQKFGYDPVQIKVAVDAVGVYVHPENPLAQQGLSLQQLDAIFSKTRLRKGKEIRTWGDLGLTGAWAEAKINLYSRNSASGTYSFFKKTVMSKKGKYRDECKKLPGSEQLVEAIAQDRYGIGYSGIGYLNETIKAVPLGKYEGAEVFPPEMQHTYTGDYPLSRFLYLAVNKQPKVTLKQEIRAFIDYIYSAEGQNTVTENGFFSLSSKVIGEEKYKLEM